MLQNYNAVTQDSFCNQHHIEWTKIISYNLTELLTAFLAQLF